MNKKVEKYIEENYFNIFLYTACAYFSAFNLGSFKKYFLKNTEKLCFNTIWVIFKKDFDQYKTREEINNDIQCAVNLLREKVEILDDKELDLRVKKLIQKEKRTNKDVRGLYDFYKSLILI